MGRRVLVIDGHPDPERARFVHALARTYGEGVRAAGGEARVLRICDLPVRFLRNAAAFQTPPEEAEILAVREDIAWAEHIAVFFPLWLGSAPALMRAFFEQVARGAFITEAAERGWTAKLTGKSGRIVVTMGMPAAFYRLWFGGHGVESWRRSILGFAGVKPIRVTLFGGVGAPPAARYADMLATARRLGARDGEGRRDRAPENERAGPKARPQILS
ncbi:MAG: NAD(P)H-dependent oxidoreductase [Hyphomonadaceae bacterium]